ncbi:putative MFS family arabinose efflux permease [Kribbella voronezhensis]|uniref:Putative MFS family arabinose efflux permease n=1 Tax=Kribbella voronezhensis TaxID=2512212 RepID=A0A4R7TCM5_9ACTN|nr:MFS transporter [Kribbella voronezhensis]TDU89057.1 putative MFS family arabinose efflux permease [Kribbella voronezhensis]
MTTQLEVTTRPAAAATGHLSGLGLLALLLSGALPILDFFIVNVALPAIDADLDAGPALLELVIAGYGVAYAVLLVVGGRLGDALGRRRMLLIALTAFILTSLACGLATTALLLVVARIAQGASAALLNPQVLATIQTATTADRRNRAVGLYGAVAGVAMVIGQVLGGLLVAADFAGFGWRTVFLVNVPIGLATLLLASRTVPATRAAKPAPIDRAGTILLSLLLILLLIPLSEGRAAGWPIWSWLSLAAVPAAAYALLRVERAKELRGVLPLLPTRLLSVPAVRTGLVLIVPFSIGFGGFMFVFAIALQQGLHLGPVEAGVALAPLAVCHLTASLVGPRLVNRFGTRVLVGGGLTQIVGLAVLAAVVLREWEHLTPLMLLPGMALCGFGTGSQIPVMFRVVLSGVPAEFAGVGSGLMVTIQQASLAVGAALIGTVFLSLTGPLHGSGGALAGTIAAIAVLIGLTATLATRAELAG